MLVLSRRPNEKVLFPGLEIAIQVVGLKPGLVRLGIQAPPEVRVLRAEVPDREAEWGRSSPQAAQPGAEPERVRQLLDRRLEIARRGLSEARQLAGSRPTDALVLMEKVNEDLGMLQRRMKTEFATLVAPPRVDDEQESVCAAMGRRPR